jgi:hypothetical protein
MYSSANQTSPISHRRDAPSWLANLFSPAGSPGRLGIRLGPAASAAEYAANGTPYARRKAWHICKRASFHFAISRMARAIKRTGLGNLSQANFFEATGAGGKKSLTVFRCNLRPSLIISA